MVEPTAEASHFNWIEEPLRRLRMDLLRSRDLHGAFEALALAERTMLLFSVGPAIEQVVDASVSAGPAASEPALAVDLPAGLELPRKWEVLIREFLVEAFRNWRAHGRESPAQRKFNHKDPKPRIKISFKPSASGITLSYEDDGPGMDPRSLFKKAAELGLLTESEKFELAKSIEEKKFDAVYPLAFRDGLSTRDAADTEAGRGMGLSRLAAEARKNHAVIRAGRSDALGGMALVLDLPCRLLGLSVEPVESVGSQSIQLFRPSRGPSATSGGFRVFWQLPAESATWAQGHFGRRDVSWIAIEFGGEPTGGPEASLFLASGLVLDPASRA